MIRSLSLPVALAAALMVAGPALSPVAAKPGGCLKYGAAGALAGHAAGHTFKGALAGCALGMYQRHKYKQQMRDQPTPPPPGKSI
jgi:hypothetical protein